ncbi:MAG: tetratricopeptide repeat protein [Pseudomonadota bacterium]
MYHRANLCLMILGSLFFLYGCAATYHPPGPLPPEISLPQSVPPAPEQKQIPEPSSRAVSDLIANADHMEQSGELETAAASLERAVRISPKDPIPWQRLAQIRLLQKDAVQAEILAGKSNSLAGRSKRIMCRNWQIIKEARYLAGDVKGALRAEDKIEEFDTTN